MRNEHEQAVAELIDRNEEQHVRAHLFKVRLVWVGEKKFYAGRYYRFESAYGSTTAKATRIRDKIEPGSMKRLAADHLECNESGEVELSLACDMPFDPIITDCKDRSFILVDFLTQETVGRGAIIHALRRSANVQWQPEEVSREERAFLKGHKPCVVWFTGLSGAGKSTIANCLERKLHVRERHTVVLDGDNIRHGLTRDLGFTEADRIENIRRTGEVAKLMTDAGLIVLAAFISPFASDRDMVRELLPPGEFIEVFVNTPLQECERRDTKGLYRKARLGEIPNFTGINSPYEAPEHPDVTLDTTSSTVEECADRVLKLLEETVLNNPSRS
jgi:bifunctional enzyme CysN/CysC